MDRMHKIRDVILACLLVAPAASAQTLRSARTYMETAVIHHENGSAIVVANSPRPLSQALSAIRRAYGWVVDYEDPLYTSSELTSNFDPRFPSRAFKVPAGGTFQSTYPETPYMWSRTDNEQAVLDKIVADYNQSGNPGRFIVRAQVDGSYTVVGTEPGATAPPILSTPISFPSGTRSLGDTLHLITGAVSAASGVALYVSGSPGIVRRLIQSQVTIGANGVPARYVLVQAFTQANWKVAWDMRCTAPIPGCWLNLIPVSRAPSNAWGTGRPILVQ